MYLYDNNVDGEYDLTVYVPTKGRPENAVRLQDIFFRTITLNTRLVFILSANDTRLQEYQNIGLSEHVTVNPMRPGFVEPLNLGYLHDRRNYYSYSVGFMGDDHYPHTHGWDEMCVNELLAMRGGFVYGNDLFQGEAIPTSIIMSSDIPLTLGYITLPSLKHLYADNYWLDTAKKMQELEKGSERIKYLSDVIIEHLHPAAGKANVDVGYEFSSSFELDQSDKKEYERYLKEDLESEARIILSALRRMVI